MSEFSYVDKVTRAPCPRRGNALCTITDPAHRHIAAHMVPGLRLTVRPGVATPSVLGMVEALGRAEGGE